MEKTKEFFKEFVPYIIIIILIVLIRSFVITPVRVDGNSMVPTLEDKEILILKKYDKSYKRFDIVVFNYGGHKLIKRIIGLPGETVEIKNNQLYINKKIVKETFEHRRTSDYILDGKIPDEMYFVMGDNRTNSLDSRVIGLIAKDDINGTVGFSIFPPKVVK